MAYLATVPLFAALYTQLPADSLHDANIGLETSVAHDASNLIDALSRSVNSRVERGARWHAGGGTFRLSGPVRVSMIGKPQHGAIPLNLEGEDVAKKQHAIGVGVFDMQVEATLESAIDIHKPGEDAEVGYPATLKAGVLSTGDSRVAPPLSILLPAPPGSVPLPQSDHGVLLVPQKVDSKLVAFALATEGDPYYASGRFGRMLYLSATTITTLGLGDVTPISGMARLLVGLEALFGIVFIGLFLNNLAKIASGRRSPSTSAFPSDT